MGKLVSIGSDRRLVVDGQSVGVKLRRKHVEILQVIAGRSGAASMDEVASAVYPGTDEDTTGAIRVHICHLRQRLGPYADLIETVPGGGYCIGAGYTLLLGDDEHLSVRVPADLMLDLCVWTGEPMQVLLARLLQQEAQRLERVAA